MAKEGQMAKEGIQIGTDQGITKRDPNIIEIMPGGTKIAINVGNQVITREIAEAPSNHHETIVIFSVKKRKKLWTMNGKAKKKRYRSTSDKKKNHLY